MQLTRGFRCKLGDHIDVSKPLSIQMETQGPAVYDTCCFGIDGSDKISDDRYTIFYNQTASPEQAITYGKNQNTDEYTVSLSQLPENVAKLVFTVSIDGTGTMGDISSHTVKIFQDNAVIFELALSGKDFKNEKAIIDIEMYRKDIWRMSYVARGFDGGLDALVKNYGGEIKEETEAVSNTATPDVQSNIVPDTNSDVVSTQNNTVQNVPEPSTNNAVQNATEPSINSAVQNVSEPSINSTVQNNSEPASESGANIPDSNANAGLDREEILTNKVMSKISLSKDKINLEKHVVNLSKCVVNIEKSSGVILGDIPIKVVVAIDYSASMKGLYHNGTVQRTLNRLVPLGLTFDDNCSVDLFLFQSDFRKFPDLDLSNYETYVNNIISRSDYRMGGTKYSPVINAIVYGGSYYDNSSIFGGLKQHFVDPVVDNFSPTFVLFITDGENLDKQETDATLRSISAENVFVQFVGIGKSTFHYLEHLDDMQGRVRDNTGFSMMAELDNVDDFTLYNVILEQFSMWLRNMQ